VYDGRQEIHPKGFAMTTLDFLRMPSPVGELLIVCSDRAVQFLDYHDYEARMHTLLKARYGAAAYTLREAVDPLEMRSRMNAYFAGQIDAVDDIAVETGGTPFQQQVWLALRTIPAGQTATYGQQAARIGRPAATRAVGRTNGLNPIAIILPCHRVIGANGQLTGYAGGLHRKAWLLQHEGWPNTQQQARLAL
jgi:methylated-DNA-[protein]-cysteine S-methyltransferase